MRIMSANLIISLNRKNGELKAEVAELKARVADRDAELRITWSDEDDPLAIENAELKTQLSAMASELGKMTLAYEMSEALRVKSSEQLHTLETAVRAVRDARDLGLAENMLDILSKRKALYALVPDGSEGESCSES